MNSRKIVIDIGNTLTKAAVFEGKKLKRKKVFRSGELKTFISKAGNADSAIISTVAKKQSWNNAFPKQIFLVRLSQSTPLPIINKYKTPKTLGNDRLANAVGVAFLFPSTNVLTIDMGTCIKYDFVSDQCEYFGGAISPGIDMRYKSLNDYTARLPLLKKSGKIILTGRSTREAIQSGVENGALSEMNNIIESYRQRYRNLKVIVTGGDYRLFAPKLKKPIFAAPDLTLIGLNEILDYNIE